jgi:hypothetical protein
MIELLNDDLGTGLKYTFEDIKIDSQEHRPHCYLRSIEFREMRGGSLCIAVLPKDYGFGTNKSEIISFFSRPIFPEFIDNSRSMVLVHDFLYKFNESLDLSIFRTFFNEGRNTVMNIKPNQAVPNNANTVNPVNTVSAASSIQTPASLIERLRNKDKLIESLRNKNKLRESLERKSHSAPQKEAVKSPDILSLLCSYSSGIGFVFKSEIEAYIQREEELPKRQKISDKNYPFFREGWEVRDKTCIRTILAEIYPKIQRLEKDIDGELAILNNLENEIHKLESDKNVNHSNIFSMKDNMQQTEVNNPQIGYKKLKQGRVKRSLLKKTDVQWDAQIALEKILDGIVRNPGIYLVRSLHNPDNLEQAYKEIVSFWDEVTKNLALETVGKQFEEYARSLGIIDGIVKVAEIPEKPAEPKKDTPDSDGKDMSVPQDFLDN